MASKTQKTDPEWRKQLSPEQYGILREKGTEHPFSGEYWNDKSPGLYRCAGCGLDLFDAGTKFDSGTGWPSFFVPIDESKIASESDTSHGMQRSEVICAGCGGHLGHVFPDGPPPTGLRYCLNSVSLILDKSK